MVIFVLSRFEATGQPSVQVVAWVVLLYMRLDL